MEFTNILTIVIPLYTRYDKLKRVLTYYKDHNFPFNIMILDDSPDQNIDDHDLRVIVNDKHIKHIMYEQHMSVAEKISIGIKISTPYVVLCADDDFVVPKGLERCIEFLDANSDYVAAQGKHISFKQSAVMPRLAAWEAAINIRSIECESPVTRFITHFSDYNSPTFYAVHRTNVMQSIWKSASEYTNDVRFGELLPTLLTVLYGKVKVLDILYAARENHPSSDGHVANRISDFIVEGSFDGKYERFKKCLAGELCDQTELSYGESEKLVDRAMDGYLKRSFGLSINALRFKLMIKKSVIGKVINSTGLLGAYRKLKSNLKQVSSRPVVPSGIPYDDPTHSCYSEFSRIREAINSGA